MCDQYALALAQTCQQQVPEYPPVGQVPNFYLQDLANYIRLRQEMSCAMGIQFYLSVSRLIIHFIRPSRRWRNFWFTCTASLTRTQPCDCVCTQRSASRIMRRFLMPTMNQLRLNYLPTVGWRMIYVGQPGWWVVKLWRWWWHMRQGIRVASCLPANVITSALPHKEIPRLFPYKQ